MALFDLPIDDLFDYEPDVARPDDFDDFWLTTMADARQFDLDVRIAEIDNRQRFITTHDVVFAGFGGSDVRAWLHVPVGAEGPLPTVIQYHGYSGGRGMPTGSVFASAGYAHLVLDTRGQGWSTVTTFATTSDPDPAGGSSHVPGVMTRGVESPETYYYRRLFTDCVRLIEVAAGHPAVDASRIVLHGGSQGGGMTIAAAGIASLTGLPVAGAMPDVPFLCHYHRACELVDTFPYKEISDYLRSRPRHYDQVFETLSYFDGVNFAERAAVSALFSVGLMDMTCPPSTVFAAYNAWGRLHDGDLDKAIEVYPHNGHEGGRELQLWQQLGWLRDLLGED